MADKTFVGSGWEKKFDNGGSLIRVSIKREKIELLPTNKYGDILLVVQERRTPDEKSKSTHFVCVDDYAYSKLNDNRPEIAASAPVEPATKPETDRDGLPF